MMIKSFSGQFEFLSNFFPSPITFEGLEFPSVEHAFQAAKTNDQDTRIKIRDCTTPGKAKRAGGKKGIIKDMDLVAWEAKKISVMRELVRLKFLIPELREKLIATGDTKIQEGNMWNDTFWGVSLTTGQGQNWLGRILEEVRSEIQ